MHVIELCYVVDADLKSGYGNNNDEPLGKVHHPPPTYLFPISLGSGPILCFKLQLLFLIVILYYLLS